MESELQKYDPSFKQKLATKVIRNIERKYSKNGKLSDIEIHVYSTYMAQ